MSKITKKDWEKLARLSFYESAFYKFLMGENIDNFELTEDLERIRRFIHIDFSWPHGDIEDFKEHLQYISSETNYIFSIIDKVKEEFDNKNICIATGESIIENELNF